MKVAELLNTVRNAAQVIAAIHELRSARPALISERSSIDIQSVRRALTSLSKHSFVRKDFSGEYVLGPAWRKLSDASIAAVHKQIQDALDELATEISETVTLTRVNSQKPPQLEVMAVANGSRDLVRVEYETGYVMPLLPTAAGKIAVAYGAPSPATLHLDSQEITEIRLTGVSRSANVLLPGMTGLASPILDHEQQLLAMLSVIAPDYREVDESIVVPILHKTSSLLAPLVFALNWKG